MPPDARRGASAAPRSCSRSARSNRARTSPHLVERVRRCSPPTTRTSGSSSPGRDGPARPAVDAAIARLPADARERVVLAGRVDDAGRRALLEPRRVLAYPSIYEGFGFPLLEAMSAGRAGRRGARGLDPRGRGRRRAARRADRRARRCADALDRVLTDDTLARGARRAGPRPARRVLVGGHGARARRRATAGSRSSGAVKVALPRRPAPPARAGRDRPLRALAAARASPTVGVDAVAFAAGRAPAGRAARASRGSTSARRTAACATSCWHRLRRPLVDIDADVVHAPSLAVPPVRDAALVVTVHDIAFLRVPHVTTRRGVSFHRRGARASRAGTPTSCIAPSAFTRVELDPRRVQPRRRARRAVRRRPAAAARPTTTSTPTLASRRRRAAVRAHRRHGRAAQGPADDRRTRSSGSGRAATRRCSSSSSARAGWGDVDGHRPAVRARARRATVARRRRARTAGRPRAASRRATRASGSPRSKRSRAARRSRSPKAPRSRRSWRGAGAAVPAGRRRGVHRRARAPARRRRAARRARRRAAGRAPASSRGTHVAPRRHAAAYARAARSEPQRRSSRS